MPRSGATFVALPTQQLKVPRSGATKRLLTFWHRYAALFGIATLLLQTWHRYAAQYAECYSALPPRWASTTAMAVIFTISRTLAPSCKMCTGLRIPISTGPITSAPPISCNTL